VQRRNQSAPGVLGPRLPQELLSRSRVAQVLWAYRGQQAGTSLTDLCALAARSETQAMAQVEAAQRYLSRMASAWQILSEDRETAEGSIERYFWLVAPHCPRPTSRELPELHEPELISWEEIPENFPILPRWSE
jgi:hypothetical protein